MTDEVLESRRSPLAGMSFGIAAPGLSLQEEAFRTLVEVRRAAPAVSALAQGAGALVWTIGPDWWLVDGPPETEPGLEARLASDLRTSRAHVTDVSSHRTTIVVTGPHAGMLLAHGCPIDLSVVPPGGAVQGLLAGAQVVIGRIDDAYRVYVRASYARHLAAWLTDAAVEYS